MTVSLDQLAADAQKISTASSNIRRFALDLVEYLREQAQPIPAPPSGPPNTGTLLFHDDFLGTTLSPQWDVKQRGNFVQANVSVHDGLLDIVALRDSSGTWTAGEIQGLAPGAQYTGPHYSECRAKLPAGGGVWSAPLWERDAPWGSLAIENDVNEQLGKEPGKYHVTVHNGSAESFGKVIDTGIDLSADFHVYGCAMYADHADYWFDGRKLATITAQEAGLSAWKFTTTPLVALVDLDMGGWGGTITVQPPVHLLVDYVRVTAL